MQLLRKLFTVLLFVACTFVYVNAQNKQITGFVKGSDGEVLTGATLVTEEGNYALTDVDGRFTIIVKDGKTITVSYLGYDDYLFIAEGQQNLEVVLQISANTLLDEAVAIGYGKTTKKEVSGSVASLKADDFDKGAFTSAAGMLQGKVAGLSITNPSGGDPNASFEILLRGTNTLSAGQGPLIIIDGVVGADIRTVNFQEIESMDVLKDGSAAAIYGTRGTNGVLIITTKRAQSGVATVEYDGQVSIQTVRSRAIPMTAEEFKFAIENYKPGSASSLYGSETDWFKEVTRTPISHKHNLSVAGGTEKFSHRTVINVEKNQGLLKKNDSDKYLVKTNIHQKVLEGWLDFDYNFSYIKRQHSGSRTGIFRQAFMHNPTEPIYDSNDTKNGGYFTIGGMDYYNPVAMLNERTSDTDVDHINANGRVTLNILPVKGLKWDNFVSYGVENYESSDYKTRYYPGEVGLKGVGEINNAKSTDLQYESTLQYSNKFGKHSIQAIAGYAFQQLGYNSSYMYNYGFDVDFFKTNNIEAGAALKTGQASMGSFREASRYVAFFGRVMYNYAEKYLASVSLRYDGSSRFGRNNKWAAFPAISAAWRISQEDFLKDVSWIDELKLRAGFGMTGNQDFSNYQSILRVKPEGYFYYNGAWTHTYVPSSNANPDLQWEKKSEYNIGLDFSMFKNRLYGQLDYYYRYTSNLLYHYDVPVPPYDYGTLFTNVGAISNSGFEFTLGGSPVKVKDFTWNSNIVFSTNKNKLISFSSEEFQGQEYRIGWLNTPLGAYSQRLMEGESIGSFYGPKFEGFTSSGTQKLDTTSENKWERLGCAYPIFTLGWSNTFSYKNFSLSATLRGSFGGKVFNQMRGIYENITNLGLQNVLASWLDEPEYTGRVAYSSRYLESATYIKLDNVTASYDFRFDSKYIKGLRLYLTGQHLLCITGYSGVDPEVALSGLTPGIEGTSYYPRTRVFTLGVNLRF